MEQIRIEKVTLNMGTGGPGENMDKAVRLLTNLSGMKSVQTKTKKRIPGWGIRPGLAIGCKVTMRGKKAEDFLSRLLEAKSKRLKPSNFSESGSISFGIPEYLDIPNVEYDIKIGIIGLEASVTLARPGFRISKRKIHQKKLPLKVRITKDEAIEFLKSKYSITVGEEE